MPEVRWIKIVTDIFDDDKILLIESMPEADAIIVIWFKLLCWAGKQNNSGVFILNDRLAYTDEMFATIFRRPLNTIRLALQTFEQFGMIEIVNGAVTIPNWGKHQNLDRIESKNEYMRNYMREYREKQRLLSNCKTNSKSNVSEADKNREDKNRVDKSRESVRASRFTPPTTEEVLAYACEKGWSAEQFDAVRFVDFYASKGWYVGKNPMKDWKAAARGWVARGNERQTQAVKTNPATNYKQREYKDEDFGDDFFIDLDKYGEGK